MAVARKCDRCGAFYDRYNENNNDSIENSNAMAFIIHYKNDTYNTCKHFDLCPDCKDKLVNWILEGGNES